MPSSRVQTQPKPSDFFGRKNSQHAFLRNGSKAVGPVSQICGTLKNPCDYVESNQRRNSVGRFSLELSSFANRGLCSSSSGSWICRGPLRWGSSMGATWSWRRKLTGAARKGPVLYRPKCLRGYPAACQSIYLWGVTCNTGRNMRSTILMEVNCV
jgi:hypothetical protein